ncbi:MAG: host attachment protein [Alphaproteobacteria bacterium]|nr:host attachment protein [Alphaproteobacteria bacterium]
MRAVKPTTWIVICDGARGRVLVNRGKGTGLNEISNSEDEDARTPTRDLGADRPGRTYDSGGRGRHAMVPPVDWHRFEKEQFAKSMAEIVNSAALENRFDRVVLVAPPRVLGDLRQALKPQVKEKLAGEIGKDLTQVAVHDLGEHLGDLVRL